MSSAIEGNPSGTADVPEESVGLSPATPARALPAQDPGGARRTDHRGFPKCVAGARNHSSADVLHTAVRRAPRIPLAVIAPNEWKGETHYWNLRGGTKESVDAAWSYPRPTKPFAALRDYVAFYPARVDACYVGDERVKAQEGDLYGGWITSNVGGPFKAGPAPPGGDGLPRVADKTSCCDVG
jgi:hypothetical protein